MSHCWYRKPSPGRVDCRIGFLYPGDSVRGVYILTYGEDDFVFTPSRTANTNLPVFTMQHRLWCIHVKSLRPKHIRTYRWILTRRRHTLGITFSPYSCNWVR